MLLSPYASKADPLKAALALKTRDGKPGSARAQVLVTGEGWRVADVVCTSGPADRAFEEQHSSFSVALVLSGTFVYRSDHGRELMSPGSWLLGNVGSCFECSHAHGVGDRCLAFHFEPGVFERLAHDAGARGARFLRHRLAPVGALTPLVARARAALEQGGALDELALELAGEAVRFASGASRPSTPTAADERRVSAILRFLEENLGEKHTLAELASAAGLSRYHFLRTFKCVTGVTPHQWLLRARVREAAHRLVTTRASVTEISLEVGFDDLSNFTRRFHDELGVSPRRYRAVRSGSVRSA